METPYNLPNGLTIRVVDTETAGQALGNAVQSWHEGATEPLFYGSEGRPEGVVISFGQWAAYESIGQEIRFELRVAGLTSEQVAAARRTPATSGASPVPETICKVGNGLNVRVLATAAVGQSLDTAVRLWREGAAEPLFYGAAADPEGVVVSFGQWAEYEAIDVDSEYDGRGAEDSHEYLTPNGDTLYVNTTAAVRHNLGRILGLFREGSEPVFFADAVARPEAVVISFREWVGYEIESADAAEDRRRQEVVRRLEARDPSRKVTFEEAAREGGWDPDVPPGPPDVEADHRRRLEAALDAVITDWQYPLPNGAILSVTDIGTVGENLGGILESFRNGSTEPVFFAGDQPRPEGVILSFDQWADYEELKEEAESDRRRYDLVRERLANDDPSNWVTFEELMEELGLDPDSDELTPRVANGTEEPESS